MDTLEAQGVEKATQKILQWAPKIIRMQQLFTFLYIFESSHQIRAEREESRSLP